MSHCQLCAREIKSKLGKIAHHGYTRKQGWQSKSCNGARGLPYEQSRDLIPAEIQRILQWIGFQEVKIKMMEEDKAPVYHKKYLGFNKGFKDEVLKPSDAYYKMYKESSLNMLKSELKSANMQKDWLQERYNKWRLMSNGNI